MPNYKYLVRPFAGQIQDPKKIGEVARQLNVMIDKGVSDGWEFYRIDTIQVNVQPGCLGILSGIRQSVITFNFVIFRQEAVDEKQQGIRSLPQKDRPDLYGRIITGKEESQG